MSRQFLIIMTLVLACLLTGYAKQERPNIVWIVSEDNSSDWLRLYNKQGAPMPNVERLAAQGLVFNHAFSCAPVCSVARSTIISGCYAPRLGAQYHRKQQTVPMPDGLKMFPYYLRQAGYHTTNRAKKDYNFNPEDEAGVWDESGRKASWKDRKPGQPFFHVRNFATTHESRLHFKNLNDPTETDPASVVLYPYHPETDTFRYTYARYLDCHRKLDQEIGSVLADLEKEGLMDDTFIFYYGDHGGVLPRGKGYIYDHGLQVPMVVYIPDSFKHLAPASAGTRIDGFVEFVDLSATVLNLANAEIPDSIDGSPFLGKDISLNELNARDTAFGYADRFDEKYDLVRTLRKGRFKYMRSYQPFNFDGLYNGYRYKMLAYREWRELFDEGQLNDKQSRFFQPRPPEALFDLKKDPNELHDLSEDPAYADQLAELRGLLRQQIKSMPDLSFYPEPVFLAEGGDNPTAFGNKKKTEIARLVDIADLSLKPFPEIKPQLERALNAANPWERYWGLITCSAFGEQAAPFYEKAETIAAQDEVSYVRIRAAEFLGLTGAADPRPIMNDVLAKVSDPMEANLILNSVVLLKDAGAIEFDAESFSSAPWAKEKKGPARFRLQYLLNEQRPATGDTHVAPNKQKRSKLCRMNQRNQ